VLRRISERLRWRMQFIDAQYVVDVATRATPEGDGPLFLFVNFIDAHSPYNPPERALRLLGIETDPPFSRYSSHRILTKAWKTLPGDKEQSLASLYDGELRWIDLQLERLLRRLEEDWGPDSVIIVTSDHGEELGEENRVGHEYGLAHRLLHVPLFIRSANLPPGDLEDSVDLRNLHDFILMSARGRDPGVETLVRVDEYGIVSERYPSSTNIRSLGKEYALPWVSLVEGRYRAVGPSPVRSQMFEIRSPSTEREIADPDPELMGPFRDRIDTYWESHRDRREEDLLQDSSTREELEVLKALGYVD
jgi:hypothetical protein